MKRTIVFLALAALPIVALFQTAADNAELELVVPWSLVLGLAAAAILVAAMWASLVAQPKDQPVDRMITIALGAIALCGLAAACYFISSGQPLDDGELLTRFRVHSYRMDANKSSYLGVNCLQYPNDQWAMQEIISEVKPDFIVETGTWKGATALFYAHVLKQVNPDGRIITVDLNQPRDTSDLTPAGLPVETYPAWHETIEFIQGNCISEEVVGRIAEKVAGHTVLVTLDSSHETNHVAAEIRAYAPLVSVGSYIVVQDTHLGGHPNFHHSVSGLGPMPSVLNFVEENPDFVIDHSRERYLVTQNPNGYLKRISRTASP